MTFALITILVLLLYIRTYKYKYLIDDPISILKGRAYAPWAAAMKVDHAWYEQVRTPMYFITNVGTTLGVCLALYMIWGWKVALCYALLPTNTSATTWSVGNYYQTTVLFILTGFYFLTHFSWGWIVSSVFYLLGMWQALSALPYLAVVILMPLFGVSTGGFSIIAHSIALGAFMGTKFRKIWKARTENMKKEEFNFKVFDPRKILLVVRVIAYYIVVDLWPSRLGFFHDYLKNEQHKALKLTRSFWLSLLFITVFTVWAYSVDPFAFIWFILFIGIFSQFVLLGQFIAERYMFLANVGFCILVVTFLEPYPILFAILMTLYFYRTHLYIPGFKNNYNLFATAQVAFPHSSENYVNWASYLLEEKRALEAIKPLQLAIIESPDDKSKLWCDLASCFIQLERYPQALDATINAMMTPDESMRKSLEMQRNRLQEMCFRRQRTLKQLHGSYYG